MINLLRNRVLKHKTVQDTVYVTIGMVVSRLFLFARDFFIARIIGPENYGIWVRINLVLNYTLKSPVGFEDTMSREDPYFRGSNQLDMVDEVRSTTLGVTLITAVLIALTLIGEALINNGSAWLFIDQKTTFILGFLIIAQQIFGFYSISTRNRRDFASFSVGMSVSAILTLVLSLILTNLWGVAGIIASLLLGYVVTILFWHVRGDFSLQNLRFSSNTFLRMVKIALPLFGVGITMLLHTTIDRIMVARFLTNTELGYYGLSILIVSSLTMVSYPIATVTSPRLFASYGRAQQTSEVRQNVVLPILATAYLLAIVVGLIWTALDSLVELYLPQYVLGVPAAQIIAIHAYFLAVPIAGGMLLTAADRQKLLLVVRVVMLALSVGLIGLSLKWESTITGIALATAISSFVYMCLMLLITDQQLADGKKLSFNLLIRGCFPLIYVGIIVFVAKMLISMWFGPGLIAAVLTSGLFLLFVLPLVWAFYRETIKERELVRVIH